MLNILQFLVFPFTFVVQSITDDPSWILVVTSLFGNIFVIHKNVLGHWLWAFSNVGWISYYLTLNAHPPAFLFTVYLGLSIWGIYSWTKEERKNKLSSSS